MVTDVIILAGGYGERLWPASTKETPKQFLSIKDGLSFLQQSILRAAALDISGKIIIATRAPLEAQCALQIRKLCDLCCEGGASILGDVLSDDGNKLADKILRDTLIIAEPVARHTCAPVTLGCHLLNLIRPDITHNILVLTSDHIIEGFDHFNSDVIKAADLARDGYFVCFGVPANSPSVEYGYIQTGNSLGDGTFCIERFHEKPDEATAKEFIDSGKCFWNSGMFAFNGDFYLSELGRCTPLAADAFSDIENSGAPHITKIHGVDFIAKWVAMDDSYNKTPAIAIDKAVAEKTSQAAVVVATFGWDDIGSWDSFSRHCNEKSKTYAVGSDNCFVYSDISVALCGVSDLNVIIKNGKALIMKKGNSALVRKVVEEENKGQ